MSCKDNKDGSCTVEYIPFAPGDYDVNITFGGRPIPGGQQRARGRPRLAASFTRRGGAGAWLAVERGRQGTLQQGGQEAGLRWCQLLQFLSKGPFPGVQGRAALAVGLATQIQSQTILAACLGTV